MNPSTPIRVGAVAYLNTQPLVYRLDELAPYAEVVYDLPSRLADNLARGWLDVALIPSVELLSDPDYTIVSDACIACRGPVFSVKLLSRKPLSNIRTLALDEGSRTSVALVQILLDRKFGILPEFQPLPIGHDINDTDADAVLLIGDRAMHCRSEDYAEVWDLGEQWCRWSELPFVFAMWTARPGIELHDLEVALGLARDAGLQHIEEIADQQASVHGLTREGCLSYLRDNLHFTLGDRERLGLETFYQEASRLGLAPSGSQLAIRSKETT